MLGLSFEHFVVLGVALVIFGPKRLPELGVNLGKAIKNFKDAFSGVQEIESKKVDPAAIAADEVPAPDESKKRA